MKYGILIADPDGYFYKWYVVQQEKYPVVTDKPEKVWKSKKVAEKTLQKLPYIYSAKVVEVQEGADNA